MISIPEQALAVSTALAWIREVAIIGTIAVVGWNARALYQHAVEFKNRIIQHMDKMENFAHVAVENHLKHIERDIRILRKASGSPDPLDEV